MKIRPVGAQWFHAGGRDDRQTDVWTDMTKLIVAFRHFENSPINGKGRNKHTSEKKEMSKIRNKAINNE
jgi:hypothetical protein